jgi:hypothetical protein
VADEIKIHSDRAMAELDLAIRAGNARAARAHMALSALHLERLRDLSQAPAASPPERSAA